MKIVIVGAGPGGSTAAMLLAQQRGHEVVLLDRDQFPRMKTCGSGLGPRCLTLCKEIGLFDRMKSLALGIRGCRFVGPSASVFHSAPSLSVADTNVGSPPIVRRTSREARSSSTTCPRSTIARHCSSV